MLQHLYIQNYGLIQALMFQPDVHFTVVTGETGAGKSAMLEAVGLLLGERADRSVLLNKDQKCVVEGVFSIQDYRLAAFFEEEGLDYDSQTVLRREVTPEGKSRAFINDTPVKLTTLQSLSACLLDVHSQYDTLSLGKPSFQLDLVDAYVGNQALKEAYEVTYRAFQHLQSDYARLLDEQQRYKSSVEYHQFLFQELQEAQLMPGEQARLEETLTSLENVATLQEKLHTALAALDRAEYAAAQQIVVAERAVSQLASLVGGYDPLRQRLEACLIELRDLVTELEHREEALVVDPQQLEASQRRLDVLYRLQRKHQVQTVEALCDIASDLQNKLHQAGGIEEELQKTKKALDQATSSVQEAGRVLSLARQAALPAFTKSVEQLLYSLGMPDAQLTIILQPVAPQTNGIDEVQMRFSANKGIMPRPLQEVASGGEFARLMFCFKFVVADKTKLPTIIFDEIDTGISGEIAIKMADMMRQMAKAHQIIVITHLPQIACRGTKHYFVYKDTQASVAMSKIKELSYEERIMALAKMMGGERPSEIMVHNAKEMLQKAQ